MARSELDWSGQESRMYRSRCCSRVRAVLSSSHTSWPKAAKSDGVSETTWPICSLARTHNKASRACGGCR